MSYQGMFEDDDSDALVTPPRPRRKIRPPGLVVGRIWSASCEGKVTLKSHNEALLATRGDGRGRDRKGRSPYHCPHCGEWHLGQGKARQTQRYKELKAT